MLMPWAQTLGVLLIAAFGAFIGLRICRLKHPYWVVGFVIPFIFFIAVLVTRRFPELVFVWPFSFFTHGRNEFVILSTSASIMFGTLIPRLRTKGQKVAVTILAPIAICYFGVPPFLAPALIRSQLEKLHTYIEEGVCHQTTGFTCGAASAVTALLQFGIESEEGQLAIESFTNSTSGVPETLLASTIEKLYGDKGISCQFRRFDSVNQLRDNCPTIATIKFELFVDHYVTVLDVNDSYVTIGDPIKGRVNLAHEEFGNIWRFSGIVVKQDTENADKKD
jgi:predicted double-glycine peptidase